MFVLDRGMAQTIISTELGNNTGVSTTDVAGFVPVAGWENPDGTPNFSYSPNFDNGDPSGATIAGTDLAGNVNSSIAVDAGDDNTLMYTRGKNIDNNAAISITSLPTTGDWAAGYDIYVYFAPLTANPGQFSMSLGGITYYANIANAVNYTPGGGFVLADSTDSMNPSTTGNYFLFSGLSGSSQTLTFNGPGAGSGNTLVTGMQIVAVPEPSTAALLLLGLSGFAFRRRRPARSEV